MKNHLQKIYYLLFAIALVLPSCTSVEKLVDQGNYEEAISKARRYLVGKKKPNPKYVYALRDALESANDRDLHRADDLKSRGASTNWGKVYRLYEDINKRQESVRSLLPLVDKHGIKADIKFVRVLPMLADARNKAAAQTYEEAMVLLESGRRGSKTDAREAYRTFLDIDYYLSNYRDVADRRREAEQLGIIYVSLEVENRTRAYLPEGLERSLLDVSTSNLDDQWRHYHLGRRSNVDYDFSSRLVLTDVVVSPERVTERSFAESKEIVDGEEYVLDNNGNVLKDSLGNDVKQDRVITITADVIEVLQTKHANISGLLVLFDAYSGKLLEEHNLTAEAIFEHYASTYQGDKRALSSETCSRLGNRPKDFPTNEALILEAADYLKPMLLEELVKTNETYMSH